MGDLDIRAIGPEQVEDAGGVADDILEPRREYCKGVAQIQAGCYRLGNVVQSQYFAMGASNLLDRTLPGIQVRLGTGRARPEFAMGGLQVNSLPSDFRLEFRQVLEEYPDHFRVEHRACSLF